MTTLERLEAALAAIQNMPPGKYTPQGHNYWAGVKVNLINLIAAEKARLAKEAEEKERLEKERIEREKQCDMPPCCICSCYHNCPIRCNHSFCNAEIKVGDPVEIIGPCSAGATEPIGSIGLVMGVQTPTSQPYYIQGPTHRLWYPASSVRKLRPCEVPQ